MGIYRYLVLTASLLAGIQPPCGYASDQQEPPQVQYPVIRSLAVRSPDHYAGRDIGAKLDAAMADVVKEGGGIVTIPASKDCLPVETPIVVPSGIWLRGHGQKSTCLSASPTLGAHPIIRIVGTPSAHAVNIVISDMTLRNGTPDTHHFTAGMDGIRADYADDIEFKNLNVTSIQGAYAIVVGNASDVSIHDNGVTNFTYAGIMAVTGSQRILIQHNLVDGATINNGVGTNAYGIGLSGYDSDSHSATYNQWVVADRNTIHNIPTWEGMDAHGGQHLWLTNNTISNVFFGIMVGIAPQGGVPVLRDVHIEGNKITQGTGISNGYGIMASGDSVKYIASDIWIKTNDVNGFGATASASAPSIGAIELRQAKNTHVIGNTIRYYSQYAILPYMQISDSEILNNVAYDMADAKSSADSAMVGSEGSGIWGLKIDGNRLLPSAPDKSPAYLIRERYTAGCVILGNNTAQSAKMPPVGHAGFVSSNPVVSVLDLGVEGESVVHDKSGKSIGHNTAGPGFWSRDSLTVVSTGDMIAGQYAITNLRSGVAGTQWVYSFPVGMNIAVSGAGRQGQNLNARVTANDGTTLSLTEPAGTTVSGAAIRYQGASVSPQ
jgi:hypothetical protein